jgi:hypothetical protein
MVETFKMKFSALVKVLYNLVIVDDESSDSDEELIE